MREQAIEGTDLQPLADNVTRGWVYHDSEAESPLIRAAGIDWQLIVMIIWVGGTITLFAWMLFVNRRFARMLREKRQKLYEGGWGIYRCPVYVAEGLKSPCLFCIGGETAVYVTPRAAEDENLLRHVRVHEEAHARQHDLIWATLRTGLLCIYWVNPFVWLAAVLSKRDCELACDERAVQMLGEEERFAYGRSLLTLINTEAHPRDLLELATTMTGRQSGIRERIQMLAARKKNAALSTVILLAAVAAAVFFTLAEKPKEPSYEAQEEEFISNGLENLAAAAPKRHPPPKLRRPSGTPAVPFRHQSLFPV